MKSPVVRRDRLIARVRSGPDRESWSRILLVSLLLIAGTIAVYAPAWHGGFIWDDDDYVTNNPLLVAPDGLWRIWFSLDAPSQYFPLVYTTFRIEHALWGFNPTGYHFVNLVLHGLNAVLVWRLLVRLQIPGALLAAVIFAFHPVQVESVAWITERKNVLMGFFFLLTLLRWMRFLDAGVGRRWLFYFLALALYLLALSAKTTACTLPAALLLILWLRKERISSARVAQVVPFVLMGIGMGLVTVWWEHYHIGTRGAMFGIGWLERSLIASRAVWFYLGKLFWPTDLTFIYPRWTIDPSSPFAYVWLLSGIAAGFGIWFWRRKAGRSVEVAALFFVATLSPLLGFIMLYTFRYTFVADHYQYLACLGPIVLVSAGLTSYSRRVRNGPALLQAASVLMVVTLAVLTWRQSASYRNLEVLWRTTISRNPDCWMAYSNLARVLLKQGKKDEAMADFAKAVEIGPDQPETRNNLGSVLLQNGSPDDALVQFGKVLERWPNEIEAHNNIGAVLLQRGQIDDAISHFQKAIDENPAYAQARNNLGNALQQQGRMDEAIVQYEKTLELPFDHAESNYNLGNALTRKGDVDAAIARYRQAVALRPTHLNAHINLGNALQRKGVWAEAIAEYRAAAELQPDSVLTQNNLAWVLATCPDKSLRDRATALKLAEHARQLSGNENPLVLRTLAAAFAESGRFGEAAEAAHRGLSLVQAQGDTPLAEALQREIDLYTAGSAYRD